jgi:hypothetical protein
VIANSGAMWAEVRSTSSGSTQEYEGGAIYKINFDASRNWTGSTSSNGGHSHTVTINNTGSGQSFSVIPPYIKKAWFMKVAE